MRVLHTADFHAGRNLRGLDRTPEVHEALLEIAGLARSEKADVVLVSGDLFDTVNPSAEAEAAVFDFFLRLRDAGIPAVAIAGNHDSAARLHGLAGLLGWVGVQLVAQPTANPLDLIRTVETRGGERLTVGALPFLSERRLVKAADVLGGDVGAWRQKYREGMGFFLRRIAEGFRGDSVNMLMAHATMDGATPSGSERTMQFDLMNAYTLSPLQLPAGAQYVALGHVHKPQKSSEMPLAYYPGSVIQLDFGEGGEKKQVNLVEVEAGRPARVTPIPLTSGRELRTVRVKLDQVESRLAALAGFGGLVKVVVQAPGGTALPGLKDRVLRQVPNTLAVELDAVQDDLALPELKREGLSLAELYERFHNERRGELPTDLRAAFHEADEAARGEAEEVVA
ncbi:exonuclease SbcCD subunit D [Deinococcus metallilatus]|uniref:Nuclease SbcCD subunit D n=1 Tax=Deinococcus metallilatus TaxID=1211322 RepID=A0AAJ5F2K5_9DEIO|nr:exonuclease SbcCD subunit D [Deinococcus metallilatus]MBB5295239.1 exonuclease SbcD [Deinococcus metallilatus]QBY08599.1 exonuclease SbcCD subunit D [Deinococcus metallilatus]RXJ10478.1 exonuclease SbcCD subunit D [Deinococcus metallilatus]TLK26449.1 exonuclease SbcCD subunit D [Deinococcus metallilatus]GMA15013.1 nuclease SbcCD subunit D [Deinococcus metallilatus]